MQSAAGTPPTTLCACSVPGTVLSSLQTLTHLILPDPYEASQGDCSTDKTCHAPKVTALAKIRGRN